MSNAYLKKLWRGKSDPSQTDIKLAQALVDLEASVNDLKAELKSLQFTRCVDVKVSSNKNARVIIVPYIFRQRFQKIQSRLTRELSKKFGGIDVIFIAERAILPRSYVRRKGNQKRPRSRTLTAVHEAILNDITHPTQIVGKRTKISVDGRRVMKVYLDPKERSICDEKRETFTAVYKKFCNKTVKFTFPQ
jgi:small subunit ribosomal protein S7e